MKRMTALTAFALAIVMAGCERYKPMGSDETPGGGRTLIVEDQLTGKLYYVKPADSGLARIATSIRQETKASATDQLCNPAFHTHSIRRIN
jgi:hypothetical protein